MRMVSVRERLGLGEGTASDGRLRVTSIAERRQKKIGYHFSGNKHFKYLAGVFYRAQSLSEEQTSHCYC